ncbi:hypothetical protein IAR55_004850 [Kwoniella newhampshirensis]|uniref:non-specific serine/threonine protein kinase n=1 Tax=Kwoniella newhampshirensis TaxID=1651941 RepID=A0AAW0YM19_9TREE
MSDLTTSHHTKVDLPPSPPYTGEDAEKQVQLFTSSAGRQSPITPTGSLSPVPSLVDDDLQEPPNDTISYASQIATTTSYVKGGSGQKARVAKLEDFQLIRVVGTGCAGRVLLVKHSPTNRIHAMKAISKRSILTHNEMHHTLTELSVLKRFAAEEPDNRFVSKLFYSFTDKENIYFVMEFYPGGDLATQMEIHGLLGDHRTRFYAADITQGLENLHRYGIIVRDLKPENVLLNHQGHAILADFGLSAKFSYRGLPRPMHVVTYARQPVLPYWAGAGAGSIRNVNGVRQKVVMDKAYSFVGTAEYIAPEVVTRGEYSYAVDWWALGCIIMEGLTGRVPFRKREEGSQTVMYEKILYSRWDETFDDPRWYKMRPDRVTYGFIDALLQKDPMWRLTEPYVKLHPYFSMIDWGTVERGEYEDPHGLIIDPMAEYNTRYFPKLFLDQSPSVDMSNHDPLEYNETFKRTPLNDNALYALEQAKYKSELSQFAWSRNNDASDLESEMDIGTKTEARTGTNHGHRLDTSLPNIRSPTPSMSLPQEQELKGHPATVSRDEVDELEVQGSQCTEKAHMGFAIASSGIDPLPATEEDRHEVSRGEVANLSRMNSTEAEGRGPLPAVGEISMTPPTPRSIPSVIPTESVTAGDLIISYPSAVDGKAVEVPNLTARPPKPPLQSAPPEPVLSHTLPPHTSPLPSPTLSETQSDLAHDPDPPIVPIKSVHRKVLPYPIPIKGSPRNQPISSHETRLPLGLPSSGLSVSDVVAIPSPGMDSPARLIRRRPGLPSDVTIPIARLSVELHGNVTHLEDEDWEELEAEGPGASAPNGPAHDRASILSRLRRKSSFFTSSGLRRQTTTSDASSNNSVSPTKQSPAIFTMKGIEHTKKVFGKLTTFPVLKKGVTNQSNHKEIRPLPQVAPLTSPPRSASSEHDGLGRGGRPWTMRRHTESGWFEKNSKKGKTSSFVAGSVAASASTSVSGRSSKASVSSFFSAKESGGEVQHDEGVGMVRKGEVPKLKLTQTPDIVWELDQEG